MPSRRALLAALLASLALPAAARADCPDADTPAETGTIDNVRAAVLCLVNERRVAAGVAVLRGSPYLVRSAAAVLPAGALLLTFAAGRGRVCHRGVRGGGGRRRGRPSESARLDHAWREMCLSGAQLAKRRCSGALTLPRAPNLPPRRRQA